ncbi:hypothetical protein DFH05DRAFT_1126066 [Lentinula detonsa]|uniref:Uncharacterized protein n=1 Tax=Lentinula detonsa TaxID=2804962 RepID=A0A9W8P1T0_9AGAR|nr:hypothetical protein DFH05DRAFT_1126066 [Lentinula detonsa]
MSSNSSPKDLSDIFPRIRNIDDTPPVLNSIVQGHHAPFYELGWVIPFGKVLELLGEPVEGGVAEYYNLKVLPRRWPKRKPHTTFLEPPEIKYWKYPEGRGPECHDKDYEEDYEEAYMFIYFAINIPNELDIVKDHREEVVRTACQALDLPAEDLKWYRTIFI